MSLATLRYKHVGKKPQESKQGAPVYDGWILWMGIPCDGTVSCHWWWRETEIGQQDHRRPHRWAPEGCHFSRTHRAEQEGRCIVPSQGAQTLREHIFPLGGAEARELFKAGQRPGSAVNPRSATSHAGGDGMTCFEIWTSQSSWANNWEESYCWTMQTFHTTRSWWSWLHIQPLDFDRVAEALAHSIKTSDRRLRRSCCAACHSRARLPHAIFASM